MPAGLSSIQFEAAYTIGLFQRVVRHNRGIYDDMYMQILESINGPPKFPHRNIPLKPGEIIDEELNTLIKTLKEPVLDEVTKADLATKVKIQAEKVKRNEHIRKLDAEAEARRRAENPILAMMEDEYEENQRKLAETNAAAMAKVYKDNPDRAPQPEGVPIQKACVQEFGCVPCSSQTTQDTTCSTAFTLPDDDEPVQESWVGKKTWKLNSNEAHGLADEISFNTYCCEGEARKQRLLEKQKLKTKPMPICGGGRDSNEHTYVTNQLLTATFHKGLEAYDKDGVSLEETLSGELVIKESEARSSSLGSIKFDESMFADGIAALLLSNNVPGVDQGSLLFDDPQPSASGVDRKTPVKKGN